ncbi:High affinity cAMP-specific and IBMX-insensitive 3',5'-cyclic phosphodiesterase 9A [Lunasporangiospora selenospora]|uniref:Phosphodiesterase n=1 Tax=Lunasporangiospora selenospora TaxID=979761 RepID=A0A9P6FM88_9FUNG|nr:High affinity cAMP-specific and IBMX-insensitive 3',5'-cyclic phosphodiesterase 9A [Lunasporangiospora selenospora]
MLRFVAGKRTPVESEFNVWDHTIPEIYGIILGMFIKLDLLECLNISEGELLDFIIDVDKGYLSIYYHSFYHAADVTAVLYRMLTEMNASQYLCKPDMAALLLAGLCHDIGHPGLNNLYQVNAKTEVVKVHGEASVLEKYSCSMAMDLVTKHRIFRNVEKSPAAMLPEGNQATEGHMRDAMVKAIMATDMSFHYDMLNNLNSDVDPSPTPSPTQSGPSSSPITALETKVSNEAAVPTSAVPLMAVAVDSSCSRFSCPVSRHHQRQLSSSSTTSDSSATSLSSRGSTETAHSTATGSRFPVDLTQELRQNLCNCLLHAADISNAVKPWALCKRWSDLVVQEFFRQGDIEKAQSLPVSPNMDRDQHNQPQISLGFSDFVVHPYFASLAELLPGSAPLLETLASNREQWVVLQKELEQSKKENGTVDSTAGAIATPHLEINQGSFNRHAAYDSPTFDNSSEPSRTGSPLPEHLVPGRRVSGN